ncbi:helix-turn-helix domain-containing protein [Mycolicibacterium sp. Y3]
MGEEPVRRRRGRPSGGGAAAEELREAFLDAAERLFVSRGYRATTIELIAREAGYSRGSVYRHFPTRDLLVEALIQRTTRRHMLGILDRLPKDAKPLDVITESLVIVASELNRDPLVRSISDQTDERTVAMMLANNAELHRLVETWMSAMVEADAGKTLRPGLRAKDLGLFLIATSMSLLLGVIPGSEDPATTRRYLDVFFLPAVAAQFPPASPVFTAGEPSE